MMISRSLSDLGFRDRFRILLRHYVLAPMFGLDDVFRRDVAHEIIEYYDGYQWQNADMKTAALGFGLVHYSLILNARPSRILCVGSKKGFVPALCAMACKHLGHGQIDFVDAGYAETDGKLQWGGVGLWKRQKPGHHFSFLGLSPYINTYVMTTHDFFRTNKARYQYIYIDGDHTYSGVKNDVLAAWKRLDKKGYLSLHDIRIRQMKGQPSYGVWKLWKELSGNKITIDAAGGLGIVQKL